MLKLDSYCFFGVFPRPNADGGPPEKACLETSAARPAIDTLAPWLSAAGSAPVAADSGLHGGPTPGHLDAEAGGD